MSLYLKIPVFVNNSYELIQDFLNDFKTYIATNNNNGEIFQCFKNREININDLKIYNFYINLSNGKLGYIDFTFYYRGSTYKIRIKKDENRDHYYIIKDEEKTNFQTKPDDVDIIFNLSEKDQIDKNFAIELFKNKMSALPYVKYIDNENKAHLKILVSKDNNIVLFYKSKYPNFIDVERDVILDLSFNNKNLILNKIFYSGEYDYLDINKNKIIKNKERLFKDIVNNSFQTYLINLLIKANGGETINDTVEQVRKTSQLNKLIEQIKTKYQNVKFENNNLFLNDYDDENPIFTIKEKTIVFKEKNLNINDNINLVFDEIKRIVEQPSIKYRNLIKVIKEFINRQIFDYNKIKDFNNRLDEFKNSLKNLSDVDKNDKDYKKILEDIDKKYKTITEEDKKLIDLTNEYIIKKSDEISKKESLNKEEINNYINEYIEIVDNFESKSLKNYILEKGDLFISELIKKSGDFFRDDEHPKRSVFITNAALSKLENIDGGNFKTELNKLVDKIRMAKSYSDIIKLFLIKQMNHPVSKNYIKVRIINQSSMRVCFIQGKYLASSEKYQINDGDYIIFEIITDHDKINQEMLDFNPNTYSGSITNYPSINNLRDEETKKYKSIISKYREGTPLISKDQYKISSITSGPMICYGCAGSGKTNVSFEQYKEIYASILQDYHYSNIKEPITRNDISYITYSENLRNKARLEISMNESIPYPFCYRLNQHFLNITNPGYKTDWDSLKIKTVDENDFIEWFINEYQTNGDKNINSRPSIKNLLTKLISSNKFEDLSRIIYTYYRGIYKGSKNIDYLNSYTLNDEHFKEELSNESRHYLTNEQQNEVFNVCKYYYKYLNSINDDKKHYDDNDLAINALRKLNEDHSDSIRCKNIIIDEIQDLTSIEAIAVLKSLIRDSSNIFFYGDPHQTINPTIFTDSELKNLVEKVLGKELKKQELTHIYRSNIGLVDYLIHLQNLRKNIGSYMDNVGIITKGTNNQNNEIDKNSKFAYCVKNKDASIAAIKQILLNAGAIIVSNEKEKERFLDKYKECEELSKDNVLTIYDAKGIEWKEVGLYNLLSYSKVFFEEILNKNENSEHSTIHRMFYNKYYVGCTRSKDSFVVIEDELEDSSIINEKMLSQIDELKTKDDVSKYLNGKASAKDYLEQARTYIFQHRNDLGLKMLIRAKLINNNSNIDKEIKEFFKFLDTDNRTAAENLEYGKMLMNEKQYTLASLHFERTKRKNLVTIADLLGGKHIDEIKLKSLFNSKSLKFYPEAIKLLEKEKVFIDIVNKTFNDCTQAIERIYENGK